MIRTVRAMTMGVAGLLVLGGAGGGAREARAQGLVETETVYGPATYAVPYKVKVRQRGSRERIVVRPMRARPAPVIVVRPAVVQETRLIQPAPVVETRYVQPAPVLEQRVIVPSPVVQTNYVVAPY